MSILKNPFAIKDGKTIVISDLNDYERGADCNCKCPLCNANFISKFSKRIGGRISDHFAHAKGFKCDEHDSYLMGLYSLIKHFIENDRKLYIPALFAYVNIPDYIIKEDFIITEESLNPYIGLTIEGKGIYSKKYIVYESKEMTFDSCEIEINSKGLAEALILTCGNRKLAIKINPPSTFCKDFYASPYKDFDIATLVFDASGFNDEFYTLKSDELRKLIMSQKALWYWLNNLKYTRVLPEIIEDVKKRKKVLLKEKIEKQKALEERRKQLEHEKATAAVNALKREREFEEKLRIATQQEKEQKEIFDKIFQEKIKIIEQQTEPVRDSNGVRWYKCSLCGGVKPESEFWSYGGRGTENIGKCYSCDKERTK
jgi:hypothetical protein